MKTFSEFRKSRETMRAFRASFLICIASIASFPVFGQTDGPPWLITISADKPIVVSGSNVYIKVKLTNISDHVVDCTEAEKGAILVSYSYDVRDEDGNPTRKRDMSFPYTGKHWDICNLEPGKTVDRDILLSWLYDFSKPGKYVIQISRRFTDYPYPLYAKSNSITITVEKSNTPISPPEYPVLR
ncbi:MAG: hypothetical protein WAK26_02335 [Terracidiphilus sp.]